jgi:GNAT superfamily N-acetyltransferase
MIITAQTEHLPVLTDLFEGYRAFYEKAPDRAGAEAFLRERMQQQDSVIFLAVDGEQIVGFTQLYPLFSSTRMKRLWLLNDLYVTPEFRGKGHSKALLERAIQMGIETGACEVMLETAKSNEIGNRLYPATGFHLNADYNWYHYEL